MFIFLGFWLVVLCVVRRFLFFLDRKVIFGDFVKILLKFREIFFTVFFRFFVLILS